MTEALPTFLSLSDEDFMLMLCVRAERLADPARWCRDMREHIIESLHEPKTTEEAENRMATMKHLTAESNGDLV